MGVVAAGGSSVSGNDASLPISMWEDAEGERKSVVTQWQNLDSETLFHELSSNVLNHFE